MCQYCCCPVLDSAQGTPRPRVVISGSVQVATLPVPKQILLLRHQSLPLAQIIKEMNIYSNNEMAEMLAQSLGSAVRYNSKRQLPLSASVGNSTG